MVLNRQNMRIILLEMFTGWVFCAMLLMRRSKKDIPELILKVFPALG